MTLIIAEGKPPGRKPNKPGAGRPDKLTPEVREKILAACRNHQPLDVAAGLAGVDKDTWVGWLSTAARASEFLAKGGKQSELTAYEKKCWKFSGELVKAMHQAHAIAMAGIMNAGLKRQTTVRRTRKYVGKDDENRPIYADEEQVVEAPPDTANLKWWLEKTHKRYAPRQQVEVTGADGGPVSVEFTVRLNTIKERIRAHQAAIAAESEEVE